MKKAKAKKKRNPADLTKRNNDARKREIRALGKRVLELEKDVESLLAMHRSFKGV